MSQQINLYQPIFRRQKKVFSAATIVQIVALIALGLGAIYGFGRWKVRQMQEEVVQLEARQKQATAQFEQLSREVAAMQDDAALRARIDKAQTDLGARRALLKWLAQRQPEGASGFAGQLAGLARQHRGDTWLEAVHLGEGGRQVTLEGGSQDPAAVVAYLRRLGDEPAFEGLQFDSLNLDRPSEGKDPVRFRISNATDAAPGKAGAP